MTLLEKHFCRTEFSELIFYQRSLFSVIKGLCEELERIQCFTASSGDGAADCWQHVVLDRNDGPRLLRRYVA